MNSIKEEVLNDVLIDFEKNNNNLFMNLNEIEKEWITERMKFRIDQIIDLLPEEKQVPPDRN